MKKVYIWGAGQMGALAALDMERKGKTILGFIDSDTTLHGIRRLGYEVFSPEHVKKINFKNTKIVIANSFADEIVVRLKKNGYIHGIDFEILNKPKCTFDMENIEATDKEGKPVINDLELIINNDVLQGKQIVLYGYKLSWAIEACREMLEYLGYSPAYICENENRNFCKDVLKQIGDIEIISINRLKELDKLKHIAVITASYNVDNLDDSIDEIKEMKLRTHEIYTEFALSMRYASNISIELNSPDCVLIYQCGKVGSRAIYKSVKKTGINCCHIHTFQGFESFVPNTTNQVKIITLVREPISRNLAGFLQVLGMHPAFGLRFKEVIDEHMCYQIVFDWFDSELKKYFGIDVYAYPFDKERGYSIIKQGNVEVLVMKLEKLSALENVIGEFIRAPHFKLVNANIGDEKVYKYLYQNIKDAVRIPREIFDMFYINNPKMDHFYTEAEKVAFLKKWKKNIVD